ncbi:hypothetical protein [Thalassovita taeanensis]|uniref:Intracellular proteinase inhibitor BsuPI domain-containing protein n=1 Tax=Thalassovita taeanensis TaxID=657014 RepID=A0A1H9LEX8_9RHOB|nr:hypothetical protein [Thalassovita taeanensis]SER09986.1 hypothetical protein SAMN04488092_1283 [Thalassovita taeanensis]
MKSASSTDYKAHVRRMANKQELIVSCVVALSTPIFSQAASAQVHRTHYSNSNLDNLLEISVQTAAPSNGRSLDAAFTVRNLGSEPVAIKLGDRYSALIIAEDGAYCYQRDGTEVTLPAAGVRVEPGDSYQIVFSRICTDRYAGNFSRSFLDMVASFGASLRLDIQYRGEPAQLHFEYFGFNVEG